MSVALRWAKYKVNIAPCILILFTLIHCQLLHSASTVSYSALLRKQSFKIPHGKNLYIYIYTYDTLSFPFVKCEISSTQSDTGLSIPKCCFSIPLVKKKKIKMSVQRKELVNAYHKIKTSVWPQPLLDNRELV